MVVQIVAFLFQWVGIAAVLLWMSQSGAGAYAGPVGPDDIAFVAILGLFGTCFTHVWVGRSISDAQQAERDAQREARRKADLEKWELEYEKNKATAKAAAVASERKRQARVKAHKEASARLGKFEAEDVAIALGLEASSPPETVGTTTQLNEPLKLEASVKSGEVRSNGGVSIPTSEPISENPGYKADLNDASVLATPNATRAEALRLGITETELLARKRAISKAIAEQRQREADADALDAFKASE